MITEMVYFDVFKRIFPRYYHKKYEAAKEVVDGELFVFVFVVTVITK